MGRDHDTVVGDVQKAIGRLDRDGLAGEVTADVIAVLEDADASVAVDTPTDDLSWRRELGFGRDVTVDNLERCRSRQLEAADRRDVAEALVLALVVVVGDPGIEGSLHVIDRIEARVREGLLSHRLVQALDLAWWSSANRER
jgi:hypothetical protein